MALPAGMTSAQYKAALAEVIAQGRAKIDKARQAAKEHLESSGHVVSPDSGPAVGGGGA